MKRNPLVFILILNWRRYDLTSQCLKSLEKINYKNARIVLVDNESESENLRKLVKKFPKIFFITAFEKTQGFHPGDESNADMSFSFKRETPLCQRGENVIKNKANLGFSGGNNQGIRFAVRNKADYALLLNNDTVVKSNFLSELVSYARKENFEGILTPKILYYKSNKIWAMGGKLSFLTSIPRMIGQGNPSNLYKRIIEPDYAPGCCLLIPVPLLKKVGFFDEKYSPAYYEDSDFSFRVRRLGYKIKVIPRSIIWHKVSQSTINRGAKKIGEIQSYLLARNGLIFGYLNFTSVKRLIYFFNQYILKFILYLIFKVDSPKAGIAYAKGLVDGTKFWIEAASKTKK